MIADIKDIKTPDKGYRVFGLTMGAALVVINFLVYLFGGGLNFYLLLVAAFFLLTAMLRPEALAPLYRIWMTLALILGYFTTRLVLVVLFYFVVTPIGLVTRITGKEFLELKTDKTRDSYWKYRTPRDEHGDLKGTFRKQY